jgi:hypothetical protein
MPTCTKCKVAKHITHFPWRDNGTKRNKWCKTCLSEYQRQYREKNRAKRLRHFSAKKDKAIRHVMEYLIAHPCVDCNETDPIVLTFDHRPGCVKKMNVSRMLTGMYFWPEILAEIEKCDVRCASCHIRKTARDGNWRMYKLYQEYVAVT